MRAVHDTELQARLLKEMIEVHERKRKLEVALGAVDARNQLLIERAARKDIEVYNDRHAVAGAVLKDCVGDSIAAIGGLEIGYTPQAQKSRAMARQ